jgi:aminopeptidase N
LNRHRFANVETPDLQRVFEEVSKQDLDWFFKQWVYGTGYPRLEINYQYNEADKKLNISVNQTQKAEGLTPAAFIMPMEVEITSPNSVRIERINVAKRDEEFSISVNEAPRKVVFDKELKIPLKSVRLQKIN